ncbi:MAG: FG-GAP repeat domain-containing protein [Planctomycetia bacterium]
MRQRRQVAWTFFSRRTTRVLLAVGGLCCFVGAARAQPSPDFFVGSGDYGFLSPEIYKLDQRINTLLLRDVNRDGKLDAVVINNLNNRLDVLEQRKEGDDAEAGFKADVNDLPNPGRLKHRKISMTRNVTSLEVADVNGDDRPDLVYLGEPAGLYTELQKPDGGFERGQTFELADIRGNSWALDVGDLNGDGRLDVVFLGKENLYTTLQQADGRLADPTRYRLAEGGGGMVKVLDMNADDRLDVVYVGEDPQFPVHIRFQNKAGQLGAERRFKIDSPRGVAYADLDGKPGPEVLTVSELSNRLEIHTLAPAAVTDASPTSQLVSFPFEKSGNGSQNDLAAVDVDADGRTDVVVCDADAARLTVYFQSEGEGLDLGKSFPAMAGIKAVRALDLAGLVPDAAGEKDKKRTATLAVLSEKDKSIAVSAYVDGRLTYPQALPTADQPLALHAVGSGAGVRLVYVVAKSNDDGEKYFLRRLAPKVDGAAVTWTADKIGDKDELPLDLAGKPSDLRSYDVDADGVPDLLLFFQFQPPLVVSGDAAGSYHVTKTTGGALGNISPALVFGGALETKKDAPASFLVAQNNYVRRLKLADGRWQVLDQANASDGVARAAGVEALDFDGDGVLELAFYDRVSQSVLFLKKGDDGLFSRWKQQKVGSFNLRGLRVGDFNADGKSDLLLYDADQMGVLYAGARDLELKVIAGYETPVRGGKLLDMVPGDVNGDGRTDVVVVEPIKHHLEVLEVSPKVDLKRVLAWKVYEEKTFRSSLGGVEPREVVIGDLTGDGRNDLVVLVHDRVLVYPQDSGAPEKKPDDKPAAAATPAAPAATPAEEQTLGR